VLALLAGCNMYVIDFENRLPDGAVLAPKVDTPPPPPPEPLAGSEEIAFMDSTTAQLQGCRVITTISMMHVGTFDEGLIVLRNTALRINANRMIPLRLVDSAHTRLPHRFRAKMVRCPEESEV
jgi:hypothetical protein